MLLFLLLQCFSSLTFNLQYSICFFNCHQFSPLVLEFFYVGHLLMDTIIYIQIGCYVPNFKSPIRNKKMNLMWFVSLHIISLILHFDWNSKCGYLQLLQTDPIILFFWDLIIVYQSIILGQIDCALTAWFIKGGIKSSHVYPSTMSWILSNRILYTWTIEVGNLVEPHKSISLYPPILESSWLCTMYM